MNSMNLFTWLTRLLLTVLVCGLTACNAMGAGKEEADGVGLTGIDHLADHLSVQNFWVDGYNGAQAGKGGSLVCCVAVPAKWRPNLSAHVEWHVTDWKARTSQSHEADVPIDRYTELGTMYVHFLANGQVRITLSNESPRSPTYPGARDPIPKKEPWKTYPWPRKDNTSSLFGDLDDKRQ